MLCELAFESLGNIEDATCIRTTSNFTGEGHSFVVRINEFAAFDDNKQNNLWNHDGNPPLDSFACSIGTANTSGVGEPECSFHEFDRDIETEFNNTFLGIVDTEYTIEVFDDMSVPNTYRFRTQISNFSAPIPMNSTFHPDMGLEDNGVVIRFKSVVGHTAGT